MKYSTATSHRMRNFVLAVAAAVVILSGRFAQAELVYTNVFTGTNFTIQVSEPVSLAGTSLQAVTLRAVGKYNAKPNTFDSTKSNTGGTGITANALHQIWPYEAVATPTSDVTIPFTQSLDTHFLVSSANLFSIAAPTEDYVTNHQYNSWGGFGTYLRGAFTDSTAVNSTWNFAYLVVPSGTTINLDFEIGAAGFNSETVSRSFAVPEPSTLVLLTAGILGLLACRRRLVG